METISGLTQPVVADEEHEVALQETEETTGDGTSPVRDAGANATTDDGGASAEDEDDMIDFDLELDTAYNAAKSCNMITGFKDPYKYINKNAAGHDVFDRDSATESLVVFYLLNHESFSERAPQSKLDSREYILPIARVNGPRALEKTLADVVSSRPHDAIKVCVAPLKEYIATTSIRVESSVSLKDALQACKRAERAMDDEDDDFDPDSDPPTNTFRNPRGFGSIFLAECGLTYTFPQNKALERRGVLEVTSDTPGDDPRIGYKAWWRISNSVEHYIGSTPTSPFFLVNCKSTVVNEPYDELYGKPHPIITGKYVEKFRKLCGEGHYAACIMFHDVYDGFTDPSSLQSIYLSEVVATVRGVWITLPIRVTPDTTANVCGDDEHSVTQTYSEAIKEKPFRVGEMRASITPHGFPRIDVGIKDPRFTHTAKTTIEATNDDAEVVTDADEGDDTTTDPSALTDATDASSKGGDPDDPEQPTKEQESGESDETPATVEAVRAEELEEYTYCVRCKYLKKPEEWSEVIERFNAQLDELSKEYDAVLEKTVANTKARLEFMERVIAYGEKAEKGLVRRPEREAVVSQDHDDQPNEEDKEEEDEGGDSAGRSSDGDVYAGGELDNVVVQA